MNFHHDLLKSHWSVLLGDEDNDVEGETLAVVPGVPHGCDGRDGPQFLRLHPEVT